jgi:hypothetical protein
MLQEHFDNIEKLLISQKELQNIAGYPIHKGNPREAFIKEFLQDHLPPRLLIGSGEIIDANSKNGELRNQHDIILYKDSYPKINLGFGTTIFFIESVVATIEVKSRLNKKGFEQAVKAAYRTKLLNPSVHSQAWAGHIPPKILNYIVAYDGPKTLETVYQWIKPTYEKFDIPDVNLPIEKSKRWNVPSSSIDGIFILNKGFILYDNSPVTVANDEMYIKNPNGKWIFSQTESGNLFLLFFRLLSSTLNWNLSWLKTEKYLGSSSYEITFAS